MSKRKEDKPETNDGEAEEVSDNAEPPAKKGRGRPRIHPPKDPNVPKRPRGRPPKDGGDAAAAKPKKQGKVVVRKSTTGKRGRPKGSTKKAKGRGRAKKGAKEPEPEVPEEEEEEAAEEEST